MFIVFEGPDHAGKTVLLTKFVEYWTKQGFDIQQTREPGGTPIGEAIREILKNPNYIDMTNECEAFLFAAQRSQHCKEINQWLKQNKTVVSDRFVYSSYIYQGELRGNNAMIYNINHIATKGFKPDLVILITCSVEEAIKRGDYDDRIEMSTKNNIETIHNCYLEMAQSEDKDEPDWIVIDTTGKTEDESFKDLLKKFYPYHINLI